jgi:hypothetical protein
MIVVSANCGLSLCRLLRPRNVAESLSPDRRPAASLQSNPPPLASNPPPLFSSSSAVPDVPHRSVVFPPRYATSRIQPFLPSHSSDAVLSVIFQKGYFPFLPSDILSTLSPRLGRSLKPIACPPTLLFRPPSPPLRTQYNANFNLLSSTPMTGPAPAGPSLDGDANSSMLSWEGDRMSVFLPPHAPPLLPSSCALTRVESLFNRFHIYIHDYCNKRGYTKTARELVNEADIPPDSQPPINANKVSCSNGGPSFGHCSLPKTTGQAQTRR